MQLPGRHEGREDGEGRTGARLELKALGVGLLGLGAYGAYYVARFTWVWTGPEMGPGPRTWTDILGFLGAFGVVWLGVCLAAMWGGWKLVRK